MKVSRPSGRKTPRSNKRQRIEQDSRLLPSLSNVPGDCLHVLMLFLGADDLNSIGCCNKRLRDARRHAALDQTRTGTIICRRESPTTFSSLYDRIVNEGWNHTFQASRNQTSLCIVNAGYLKKSTIGQLRKQIKKEKIRLTGVTHLDLSGDLETFHKKGYSGLTDRVTHKALSLLVPNLLSLDMSFLSARGTILEDWAKNCTSLQSITWAGKVNLTLTGREFEDFQHLRELDLTRAHFYNPFLPNEEDGIGLDLFEDETIVMWMLYHCPDLERLDIRGATWSHFREDRRKKRPFSVAMISKFLDATLSLDWLACDLSPADKNALKSEFPLVTVVTEPLP